VGDVERDAEHGDAPQWSPGEIAYREFAHEPDGLAESEVRAFLGDVADVIAAARTRELELEARVRELEGRLSGAGSTDDAEDPRAGALFAQLRDAPPEPAPKPRAKPEPEPERKPAPVPAEPADEGTAGEADDEAAPTTEPDEPPVTGDTALRRRRDALLEQLLPALMRAAKRLLQDEQNVLLDASRRARGRLDPNKLLPDLLHQRDAWVEVLGPALDVAYAGGRTAVSPRRRSSAAPRRVVTELVGSVVVPLRERLVATIDAVIAEGPYASPPELHRALAGAIGARYREWKGHDLEVVLGDVLAATYARGSFDGAPAGALLRWVTEPGTRCPDCDDNSLEATRKGAAFPTGQLHPPAHPGCRCLVVVVTDDRERRAPAEPAI
jgi:cell division septum initiation protein DivIVA